MKTRPKKSTRGLKLGNLIPDPERKVDRVGMQTSKAISKLAADLSQGRFTSVSILTGAGVSVESGIPDFRSPGGMYNTLEPAKLTATEAQREALRADPTTLITWELFKTNPFPYLEVRKPFITGTAQKKWKPTIGHFFTKLLHEKGLLNTLYTQNIDGLDYHVSGVPQEKIINVHGSIGRVECEHCGAPEDMAYFLDEVTTKIKDIYGIDPNAPKESSPIYCRSCEKAGVKPSTVLFGRNLPQAYFDRVDHHLPSTDLLLVMGTSLVVYPAAALPNEVQPHCAKVLINREPAGAFPSRVGEDARSGDMFLKGNCDDILLQLIREAGWLPNLMRDIDNLCDNSKRKLLQEQ